VSGDRQIVDRMTERGRIEIAMVVTTNSNFRS
jgi:hypothetical protein